MLAGSQVIIWEMGGGGAGLPVKLRILSVFRGMALDVCLFMKCPSLSLSSAMEKQDSLRYWGLPGGPCPLAPAWSCPVNSTHLCANAVYRQDK